MLRFGFYGLLTVLMLAHAALAGEKSGKFVKFDSTKKELTVNVNGTETTYSLSDDVKVTTFKGEPTKKGIMSFANPRVAKEGALLTVFTTKKGEQDVVTEIKLGGRGKKP